MKTAGFNVVGMGHLISDNYEPSKCTFDFAWFDEVMVLMAEGDIKVQKKYFIKLNCNEK